MQPLPLEYDFIAPQRIVFGWGRRHEIGRYAAELGSRAFIVFGSRTIEQSSATTEMFANLKASGVKPIPIASISEEPEVEHVDRLMIDLRQHAPGAGDLVIGIGGGSAIDLAKAAAKVRPLRIIWKASGAV
jgi:alcohol dehydrogenase class IV